MICHRRRSRSGNGWIECCRQGLRISSANWFWPCTHIRVAAKRLAAVYVARST